MAKYILKGILYVIPVMIVGLIIVFALKTIMPDDPVDMILSNDATEEEREEKREKLGLNDPVVIQFGNYVKGIVTKLDFGTYYKTNQSVPDELMPRFTVTIRLVLGTHPYRMSSG